MVFPVFFKGGEVLLNGVEVGSVRRQKEPRGTGGGDALRRLWRFVKRGVVHNHEGLVGQARTQPRVQLGVEDDRIPGPFEQERFLEAPLHTGRKQRGPRPTMPGNQAIHAVALRRVPIPPCCRRRNATFINLDRPFATAKEPFPQA